MVHILQTFMQTFHGMPNGHAALLASLRKYLAKTR